MSTVNMRVKSPYRDDVRETKSTHKIVMANDLIIDRSPAQKARRVDELRAELKALGYSVVSTRWLAGLIVQARRLGHVERTLEAAE